jgi:glycosyltransferase involved in cell wall biosynthesis
VDALRDRYPRVAIAHEWLTLGGGSEKVVEAILTLVPHAEIFTSVYDPDLWGPPITDRPIHPSFLDRLPGARSQYPKLLPLMDAAFRSFDLRGFDLVISSNHACAKNVQVPPGVPHVCYCHTPMRYAWDPDFFAGEEMGRVTRLLLPALIRRLRRTDRRTAGGPDVVVANSAFVADRVGRAWGRDAGIVHPPVDVDRFLDVPRAPEDFLLFFGRVVPYKRADVAVEACRRTGRRLVVAGSGRGLDRVRALAGGDPKVTFLADVGDDAVPDLFARARALLFPGVEDFGLVPVEALAAGLPVVAQDRGGVRDTIDDGRSGVLYADPSVEGLMSALERLDDLDVDRVWMRDRARGFAPARFRERFGEILLAAGAPV